MKDPHITFDAPRDVLCFVRACLKDVDIDRLYGAVEEATSDFWRERIFEDLRKLDTSDSLEDVFLVDACFPNDATEYKLGGHSNRTRHLHLDLIRVQGSWRLKKIWKCR